MDNNDIVIDGSYVFFLKGWLSNWHKSRFIWSFEGEVNWFFCAEQAFMWAKAKFFKDEETAKKILEEKTSARKCLELGRDVKDYDESKWDKARFDIMLFIVLEKFMQSKELCDHLCSEVFEGKEFVEANPIDSIWGIGLDADDLRAKDSSTWKGRNLMGKVLTRVRKMVRALDYLTVKDVIGCLSKMDPDARIMHFEMNAMDYGAWHPMLKSDIKLAVDTIKYRKELDRVFSAKEDDGYFVYAQDNDVILGS